jgi:beta-glucosidase-like glycosyl hydrolase/CubicO group peptidase (beta-lactamase class C family)
VARYALRVLVDRPVVSFVAATAVVVAAFALAFPLRAQDPPPAREVEDPVEALLAKLSLEQKAGQLFLSWSLSRSETKAGHGDDGQPAKNNHEQLLAWVREAELGGVILSLGSVDEAARLVPQLQAAAKVPLLLAGDFEGGVWFRLHGATELGNQMLVGATGSSELAEAMGRVTGEEARALGFHWVFAPVLDVNSNPSNPIINVRSFGEDPQLVARLGSALVRGVRSTGLIACGKHFPGHGDVSTDSHIGLAMVPGDAARLQRVELSPFAAAVQAGLDSVMTGHLGVPGLGEEPNVPATLSRRILTGVLREQLGFQGLIVTDALEMGGVKDAFAPGEVAVRALLAGADVLLMPPDPLAARAAVVEAVRSGRVPQARLDGAVRRILQNKAKVGLLHGGGRVADDWRQRLGTPASQAIADRIAARGLTLVRDREDLLPLHPDAAADTVLVTLLDKDEGAGHTFANALASVATGGTVRLSGASKADEVAAAAALVAGKKRVLLALHVKVREWAGAVAVPPVLQPVLAAMRPDQQVVAVSFGNPYLVQSLPAIDTYVCAYVSTERTERAAAAALRGQASLLGRLPVTIPGVAAAGTGASVYVDQAPGSTPDVGLAAELPAQVQELLQQAVADGAFPGAVCLVARHGRRFVDAAIGKLGYEDDAPAVSADTLFDLASLTKVCATTPAVLRLVAAGKLSLDDPVQKWLPAFTGTGKERVTVRHLLAHNGGLPAYERYYRTLRGKAAIVQAAAQEGLMYEPGAGPTYSDLGFVLLMAVVEAASGESFDRFVQREVLTPFGMARARFAATDGQPLTGAAPTERDERRGGIVRGFVHDENAFAMGGVSGHAGLFATGADVLEYGTTLLGGGRGLLPRTLVDAAIRPAGIGNDTSRGLGFQLPGDGGWAGSSVPAGTFAHTGFTGTSLWCDPQHDLCVVLLTNRVHPTRVNNKIQAVRRALHDLVLAALR